MTEQPLNLLTAQQIREMPITLSKRTPRASIEQPRVKAGAKKEVRQIIDVSGSNADPASPHSRITKRELIIATLPLFVRILEADDAQAAREQAGGSRNKGGVRTWYANEPDPIFFEDGEDESDDPRDGGDLNSANIQEKLEEIPWGGRTFLMPAITAADHASDVELAKLPDDQKWDVLVTLIITDGLVSDPSAFEAWLVRTAGPHRVTSVVSIGYGDGHNDAVEHYNALADSSPWLTHTALTEVSDPNEAVLDLRLASGTAAA